MGRLMKYTEKQKDILERFYDNGVIVGKLNEQLINIQFKLVELLKLDLYKSKEAKTMLLKKEKVLKEIVQHEKEEKIIIRDIYSHFNLNMNTHPQTPQNKPHQPNQYQSIHRQ